MKAFRRKISGTGITRTDALHCIPVKNIQVREIRGDNGQALLSYPVEVRPLIAGLIRRLGGPAPDARMKKLKLDELGTKVWDLLDGTRSVGQVIDGFAALQRLHPREAEVAVTLFLRELGKRGLIGMC